MGACTTGPGRTCHTRCLRSVGRLHGRAGEGPVDRGRSSEYWRILNRRKWLIVGVAVAFLVLGAVRTLMTTRLYTATVRLQIDRNVSKVVEGGNVSRWRDGFEFLRTQHALRRAARWREGGVQPQLGEDADLFKPTGFRSWSLRSLQSAPTTASRIGPPGAARPDRDGPARGATGCRLAIGRLVLFDPSPPSTEDRRPRQAFISSESRQALEATL